MGASIRCKKIAGPFPGLRPFHRYEAEIFFGRAVQVDDMIRYLEEHRFLTVAGPSGCGKSSLVRAGLLPALDGGELFLAGDQWRMVIMRPSDSPFNNLAKSLLEVFRNSETDNAADSVGDSAPSQFSPDSRPSQNISFTEAVLRSGPLGLVEAIEDARIPVETNVLILVDQFEELFRFRYSYQANVEDDNIQRRHSETQRSEANAFINLLLTASKHTRRKVYVVLTIRSDFLGDCNTFHGLPEAINKSQFLTPGLDQDQIRQAILGPLRLFDADIQSALVNRILGDIGNSTDQLPLMQHALMRMWTMAATPSRIKFNGLQSDSAGENLREDPVRLTITLDDYEEIGRLRKALSNHADEAYNKLEKRDKQVAQTLFRILTLREPARRDLRRPTPFGSVVNIIAAGETNGGTRRQVKRVVEAFSRPDRSFIIPPKGTTLEDSVFLDIGHESLIRQWDRLNQWAKEEAEAADTYRELLPQAHRWQERKKDLWKVLIGSGLLRGRQDLKRVVTWRKQTSAAWATLYGGNYGEVKELIRGSRIFAALKLVVYFGLICLALVVYFNIQQNQAQLRFEKIEAATAKSFRDDAMRNESKLYASLSLHETSNGYSTTGMMLSLDALPSDKLKRPHVHKAERALYAALHVPHEIMILKGHKKVVEFGAFSPDGKWVVTGSWDKTARIWDAKTGQSMHTLRGHDDAVVHIAFSPKAAYIATSSIDNTARIWDLETGAQIHNLSGHGSAVLHAEFSPNGAQIVTASADRTARIWDVKTGSQIDVLKGHAEAVEQAVFNSDGTQILTASWDGTGRLWDTKTGSQIRVLKGHLDVIRSASFSPNSDYAVTASEDKTARIWDVKTGNQIHVLKGHTDGVLHASFDPNGDRLVTASRDNTARIWDVEAGTEINVLEGHTDAVRHAAFSSQGDRVVTASGDKTACLWDAETGEIIYVLRRHGDKLGHAVFNPQGDRVLTVSHDKTARIWYTMRNLLRGHKDAVTYAAFSPDSNLIVTSSRDHTARLWDVQSRKEIFIMKGHSAPVLHVLFSPKGDRIVTASADKTARIWDGKTGAEIRVLQGHTDGVMHAAFNPKGDRVVTASLDKTARIWDGKTGAMVKVLSEHKDLVLHAIFSPKGNLIVTASKDNIVRLWDPITGALRRELRGHNDAVLNTAFSPDGSRLITVSRDKTASIWSIEKKEVKTDAREKTLESQGGVLESLEGVISNPGSLVLRHEGPVQQAMFSRNGNRVVTASENGIVVIWDTATADRVAILRGHQNKVNAAVFSPNGKLVLSASDDGMVRLWEVFEDPQALVDHAQKIIKDRDLTREENRRIFRY